MEAGRRTQAQRRAETRQRMVEAATGIIRAEGAPALTAERVAAAAGVSKGAFFHHFPTRDQLVAAVIAALTDRFEKDLETLAATDGSFARALIATTLDWAARDPALLGGLISAVAHDRQLVPAVDARVEAWTRRMVAQGVAPPVADLVRAALDGVLLQSMMDAPALGDDRRREALCRALMALVPSG